MAVIQDKVQIGSSSDFLDGVSVDTPAGTDLFRETVVLADPEDGGGLANIRQLSTDLVSTDRGIVTNTVIHGLTTAGHGSYVDVKVTPSGAILAEVSIANETGAWAYRAGASGTVAVPAGRRVLQITATAGAVDATMTINGGDTITIPAYRALTIEPKGNLVAPSIVFTGTTAYFIEDVA